MDVRALLALHTMQRKQHAHAAPDAPEWTIVRMPCVVVVVVVIVFFFVGKQVDGVPAAVTEARSG
jgi:hypothetical protein